MIECSCECDYDGDYCGIWGDADTETSECHKCKECGSVILSFETHRVSSFWDCENCDDFNDGEGCEDAACDGECSKGRAPHSETHTCKTCAGVGDQLLCGCYPIGYMWETIGERNGMTAAECLGEPTPP